MKHRHREGGTENQDLDAFRDHSWAASSAVRTLGAKEGLRIGVLVC